MAATVYFSLIRPTDKDGNLKTTPVAIQAYYYRAGIEVELSTGIKVIPSLFNGSRVDKSVPLASKINKTLANIESNLLNLEYDKRGISPEQEERIVRSIIKGSPEAAPQKKTVIDIAREWIALSDKDKQTIVKYRGLVKHLTKFAESHVLSFETLDHNFYDKFKAFLYSQPNPNYTGFHLDYDSRNDCYYVVAGSDGHQPIGLFDDIVFKHITNLKVFCVWASKRGYPVNPLYKEWQIIKRDYEPIYLTKDELTRLESIQLTGTLDIARDYLVLECRTGQRISDLKRFNKADIQDNVWQFNQKKGSRLLTKSITLPLVGYCAPAKVILEKYNYELPKITEQEINRSLKTVCERAGISEPVTYSRWAGNKRICFKYAKYEVVSTHTGRKTFITLCLQDPNFTAKMVMDITGIRSFKTLNHYNGKSEIGNIKKALEAMDPSSKSIMKITA